MNKKKRTGYDQTTNLPMSCSVAAAETSIRDGMGTFEHDVRPIIDILIGQGQRTPFQGLSAVDVERAFEQRSKHTRNKPRR